MHIIQKEIKIIKDLMGIDECGLFSFPVRYGIYHQVEIYDLVLHFSPSWRLTHIQSKNQAWPHPLEWIKIGLGGTKIYYSAIAYGDIAALFQQHYIPICETYPQIAPYENPFKLKIVKDVIRKTDNLPYIFKNYGFNEIANGLFNWRNFYINGIFKLLKSKVSILPPDTMICDYQVLPVVISTGCLHNCGFCTVKDGTEFKKRKIKDIIEELEGLKDIFAKDLSQIKGVFLGNLDSLHCEDELIFKVIYESKRVFPKIKNFFLFGSVTSFLKKKESFFKELENLSSNFFINIGIESLDEDTIRLLKKPETQKDIINTWHRISYLNKKFLSSEITVNILISEKFKNAHLDKLINTLSRESSFPKGTIYLSSLNEPYKRVHFEMAKKIKMATSRDVRLYPLVTI